MSTQQEQVDRNYEAFTKLLPTIIQTHRNKFALMKDQEIIGYYTSADDAKLTGELLYKGEPFSLQRVTDGSIDLGFFSHFHSVSRAERSKRSIYTHF